MKPEEEFIPQGERRTHEKDKLRGGRCRQILMCVKMFCLLFCYFKLEGELVQRVRLNLYACSGTVFVCASSLVKLT